MAQRTQQVRSDKLCADKFRHFVSLEEETQISDGSGGTTTTWASIKKFWAKVNPISASQQLFANRLEHRVTHIITTRYLKDISFTIDKRIIWEGRIFQIQGVIDINEKKKFIELICEEGAAT